MHSSIAIVVPAYNPPEFWDYRLVDKFNELREKLPEYHFKLYVINDGSNPEIGEEHFAYIEEFFPTTLVLHNSINRGKGFALRQAIARTKEDYIVYTDIDMPFTIESMKSIMDNLESYDVVFGIKNKEYYKQLSLQRKLVSKILQIFIKILFPRLPVSDTQCGLKGMNLKGKAIFMETKIDRYLFDLEFILNAAKSKLSLKPIPVALRDGIEFGQMNAKVLIHELFNLWKILWRKK